MKKLTILVDQDGVLADFQSYLLQCWEERYPHTFSVPLQEITEHDVEKLFPRKYRDLLREITLERGFFRALPAIPGGCESLEVMLARGHDVRICTAPMRVHRHCVSEKFDWVAAHLGQKWVERMVLTRDKTLVHGDILIDDKPNISGAHSPSWEHVLYDQPYNRHLTQQTRLTWANYQEVLPL